MAYTEANYENAVIEVFRDTLGYGYAYGPDVARDYAEPLYLDELLPALRRINSKLPESALIEAVYKPMSPWRISCRCRSPSCKSSLRSGCNG